MLSKYSMAAFVLSALPLLWWRRTAPGVMGGALLAAALAAVCLSPHLAWNAIYGAPTLLHTAEITVGGSSPGGWPALAEFLASQTLMLGPLATLLLLRPGWVAKLPNDPRLRFALALTLPLLALASVQAWQTRANMNWAAPAFIGASRLACGHAGHWRCWRATFCSSLRSCMPATWRNGSTGRCPSALTSSCACAAGTAPSQR
jgi:hypothetical protein